MDMQRRMPVPTVWNSLRSYLWRTTGPPIQPPSSISGILTIGPCSLRTILKLLKFWIDFGMQLHDADDDDDDDDDDENNSGGNDVDRNNGIIQYIVSFLRKFS